MFLFFFVLLIQRKALCLSGNARQMVYILKHDNRVINSTGDNGHLVYTVLNTQGEAKTNRIS